MSRPSTSSRFSDEASASGPIADRRPQVGEQVEILAQAQQAALGPLVERHLVPLRTADGAEDDGVGLMRLGHGLVGDRDAVGVERRAADQRRLGLELDFALLVQHADDAIDLGHDFRADAVAGEKKKVLRGHDLVSVGAGI